MSSKAALHLGLDRRLDRKTLTGEGPALPGDPDIDRFTFAVTLEGLQAQLGEHGQQRVLVGRDPLTADLEVDTVDLLGPQSTPDALARLQHEHRPTASSQRVGCRETGCSRTDHEDIYL
jgi:hypothetical protein